MGQLQGVIEDLHVLAAFHFSSISCLHCCRQLLLPHLHAKGRVRTISHISAGGTQLVSTQSQYRVAAIGIFLPKFNIMSQTSHFLLQHRRGWLEALCHLSEETRSLHLSLIRIQPAPTVLHHMCAGEELNTLPAAIHDTQLTAEPPV